MKKSQNIEKFEEAMTSIIFELYGSFPVPKVISFTKLIPETDKDVKNIKDIYRNTVIFLEEEKFITVEARPDSNTPDSKFIGCKLTSKGLARLRINPLNETKSIEQQFSEIREQGISITSKAVVSNVVRLLFTPSA
jgi:hypothetical protein